MNPMGMLCLNCHVICCVDDLFWYHLSFVGLYLPTSLPPSLLSKTTQLTHGDLSTTHSVVPGLTGGKMSASEPVSWSMHVDLHCMCSLLW